MIAPTILKRLWSLLLASTFLILSSCAEDESTAAGPKLKIGDSISMAVYKQSDLTTSATISKSGEVSFPLIKNVKLEGLSVVEATEKIRSLYAEKYLVDPSVTLEVTNYSSERITVTGAVRGPGQFDIPGTGKYGLTAAIAAAGGLDARADRDRIVIYRASGRQETYSEDVLSTDRHIPLGSGDRVVVMESPFLNKRVSVLGKVGRPGPVAFPLDGKLDILTAIAGAGGFTPLANTKKVKINRGGQIIMIDVKALGEAGNKPFYLKEGDIVNVPERLF
ncbi:polysaccharide biosynthesis/export family protein [Haloferula chungangensis]|uniref:Polysaccharide biosynthesis/export family protein n=1 Tax=Haloferula chungangensis TaxID=1048331 RepID=A0ABW2L6P1_9BACT